MNEIVEPDLARALRGLAVSPPRGRLADRLVSRWTTVQGPLGDLYVAFAADGISYTRISMAVGGDAERFRELFRNRFGRPVLPAGQPPTDLLAAMRTGYTRGLTYDLGELSPFERDVLTATMEIPAGQTRSYGWVANQIGRPKAVRAVGSALGRNPVPVLIPCHRVTRSDGTVGDYVFGPDTKQALLVAEHADLPGLRGS
jgi:methylated-DNA-[protein]-cysteine S-methyltransferase